MWPTRIARSSTSWRRIFTARVRARPRTATRPRAPSRASWSCTDSTRGARCGGVLYCILYCTVLAGAGGGRPEDGEADALQILGPHRHLPHQAITKNMEFWIFRPVHFPEPRGNCPAYSCENKYREADSVPQEEILEDL